MDRLTSAVAILRYDYTLKSGDVSEQGKMAFGDAGGSVVTTATTGLPLGLFLTPLTGDGVKKVTIRFWNEIWAYWWANDTAAPLALTDLFKTAFIKDSQTVTGTGTAMLGTILDVDAAQGVLVYSQMPARALA
jgi:hypothetical protein